MATPNWANRSLWTGDNLDIMRGMNSDSVDLIYLDPPFNSNKNYAAPIGSEAAGAAFKDIQERDRSHDQPATAVRGLQLDEGNQEPGRIRRGPGAGRSATARSPDMKTAKPKTAKRGRPENPKYQETVHIDAPPEAVAKSIMRKPPKAESEWRYLKPGSGAKVERK